MNKTIVLEPSADIRKLARQALKGYWKTAVLAVLLLEIVQRVPTILLNTLFPSGAIDMVVQVYTLLVGAPLALGITMIYLNIFRRKQTGPAEIFYGFEYMFKAIALQIVIGFFTLLWTFLFIIPGIIAAYRYSLSFYILADDPNKGIMQCINESKYLTMGNKAKMFCLDFSFIGWSFLCAIPAAIFTGYYTFSVAYDMVVAGMTQFEIMQTLRAMPSFNIGISILSIGYLFLYPYMNVATACLYELINGNLIVRRVPNGGQPMGGMPYGPNGPNGPGQGMAPGQGPDGPYFNTTPPPQAPNEGWNQGAQNGPGNQPGQNNGFNQPGQNNGWSQGAQNGPGNQPGQNNGWNNPQQPNGSWKQPGQENGWNQGTQNGGGTQGGQPWQPNMQQPAAVPTAVPEQSVQNGGNPSQTADSDGASGAVDLKKPQESGESASEQKPE